MDIFLSEAGEYNNQTDDMDQRLFQGRISHLQVTNFGGETIKKGTT